MLCVLALCALFCHARRALDAAQMSVYSHVSSDFCEVIMLGHGRVPWFLVWRFLTVIDRLPCKEKKGNGEVSMLCRKAGESGPAK